MATTFSGPTAPTGPAYMGVSSGSGPIATQNKAIATSMNANGTNPHDAVGYNPAQDPTSSVYNPTAPIPPSMGGPATNVNTPNVAQTPSPTNPTGASPTPPTTPTLDANGQAQGRPTTGVGSDAQTQALLNDPTLKAQQQKILAGLSGSGVTSPQDKATGGSGVTTAGANTPTPPDTTKGTTALQNDPGYQQLIADQALYNSTTNQTESLVNQYKDLEAQYNIPSINTQLLDMKKIIDGTEGDIRSEVTAANGFATESQVLALASARNKTVIQNYNNLLATKTNAEQQVTTLMGLASQDQSAALSHITQKLNFDQQVANYAEKFNSLGLEGIKNTITNVGVSGLYNALMNTDPTGASVATTEQKLGLQPGMLKQEAAADLKTRTAQDRLTQLQASTAETNARTAQLQLKAQLDAGVPVPAYADKPGFDAKGVKYSPATAFADISNSLKSQNLIGTDGFISPAKYNYFQSWWTQQNLPNADFKAVMSQFINPNDVKNKLINP